MHHQRRHSSGQRCTGRFRLGSTVSGVGSRVPGSGFRVQGSGFGVQGSGFKESGGQGARPMAVGGNTNEEVLLGDGVLVD